MRGLSQLYYDLVDAPDFVHEVMDFMTNAKLKLLEQYKKYNLLSINNNKLIGSSTYGMTDELPGEPFDASHVTEKNLWGFAQAQEFSEVSAEMLEEFILPYQAKILNKFGLANYGCCEAIEHKIESIEKYISNLRMISISPFTNHEIAADKCRGKYVYAWKVHPTLFVINDAESVENDIKNTLNFAKGCCISIMLSDAFAYGGDINKFHNWLRAARKAIDFFDF